MGGQSAGERAELRVALVQHAASPDPARNRERLGELSAVAAEADLVVLPEAYARDFGEPGSDLSAFAETLQGPFVGALAALSAESGAVVVAGMFERSQDPARPYNTVVVVRPDGSLEPYRKIHLYDSFGYRESDRVSAGPAEPTVVDVGGLRLGLMTCYDLRFPELGRALSAAGAEVLLVPAAWVAGPGKVGHWQTLTTARAIENVCWVVAPPQPAPRYCGHSRVVDPLGEVRAEAGAEEQVLLARIDRESVLAARAHNPSLANRRM